jgi:hypothetical protein
MNGLGETLLVPKKYCCFSGYCLDVCCQIRTSNLIQAQHSSDNKLFLKLINSSRRN